MAARRSGEGLVEMIEPIPLMFGTESTGAQLDDVPLIEAVLRAYVGRCQACGRPAEEQHDGSMLTNLLVVEGTLYGDTYCAGCINEDEVPGSTFELPPVPDELSWEGDS
jgi:hypothetical protein